MYQEIGEEQRKYILSRSGFRSYKKEIECIVGALNKKRIVSIVGLKNTGKTPLIQKLIEKTQSKKEFFYYNSHKDALGGIKNREDLMMLIDLHIRIYGIPRIIILQNVSDIEGIKGFISELYKTKKYKIIIIDNNIKIEGISDIEIFPLSYDTQKGNENFYGGIPTVRLISQGAYKELLLSSLADDIVLNDITIPYNIKNPKLFSELVSYLAQNSIPMSQREIHRNLIAHGIDISLLTLIDYLSASHNSKLIKKCVIYDCKLKKEIRGKSHYYFGDLGIRQAFSGDFAKKYTQNLLFLEFQSAGYEVYSGINGKFHFDFLAQNEKSKIACHVHQDTDINEIRKTARKLAKLDSAINKFVVVEKIQDLNIRKYEENGVWIVGLEEFLGSI